MQALQRFGQRGEQARQTGAQGSAALPQRPPEAREHGGRSETHGRHAEKCSQPARQAAQAHGKRPGQPGKADAEQERQADGQEDARREPQARQHPGGRRRTAARAFSFHRLLSTAPRGLRLHFRGAYVRMHLFGKHLHISCEQEEPYMAQLPKYYIVEAQALPEVFLKVAEAKWLLETGEVATGE